jgi:hypothetical protein
MTEPSGTEPAGTEHDTTAAASAAPTPPAPATPPKAVEPGADSAQPHRTSAFHRRYGAGPGHLVGLLVCFLVAGYAVSHWLNSPSVIRLGVWFVGALLLHDVVLFPLYSLLDRALRVVVPTRLSPRIPLVNHVRVPLLFSGLLLLLWFPLIFNKPEPAYRAATGLDTSPYLHRWLLVTAGLVGASAVLYAVRWVSAGRARSPRSGAKANSAMPSAKPTEAENPSS